MEGIMESLFGVKYTVAISFNLLKSYPIRQVNDALVSLNSLSV